MIEASIDHSNGWLLSNEVVDLYSTEEPQKAFHKCVTEYHVILCCVMLCYAMSCNVLPCCVARYSLPLIHGAILTILAIRVLPPNPSNMLTPLFHCRRIAFCLDVHNEAVKCMRYPPDAYKKELALGDKDRKDEKSIEELIKELEDEYEE